MEGLGRTVLPFEGRCAQYLCAMKSVSFIWHIVLHKSAERVQEDPEQQSQQESGEGRVHPPVHGVHGQNDYPPVDQALQPAQVKIH